jgi:hypothetical protein
MRRSNSVLWKKATTLLWTFRDGKSCSKHLYDMKASFAAAFGLPHTLEIWKIHIFQSCTTRRKNFSVIGPVHYGRYITILLHNRNCLLHRMRLEHRLCLLHPGQNKLKNPARLAEEGGDSFSTSVYSATMFADANSANM